VKWGLCFTIIILFLTFFIAGVFIKYITEPFIYVEATTKIYIYEKTLINYFVEIYFVVIPIILILGYDNRKPTIREAFRITKNNYKPTLFSFAIYFINNIVLYKYIQRRINVINISNIPMKYYYFVFEETIITFIIYYLLFYKLYKNKDFKEKSYIE